MLSARCAGSAGHAPVHGGGLRHHPLDRESLRHAGEPGIVLARRLSNAEYDYTIRDLTHADIHPTREFPVDPANEAGFDNSGESLAMSPAITAPCEKPTST